MDDYINIEQLLPNKYSNYKRLYYWDTDKKMIVIIIYIDSDDYIFYWFDPSSYELKVFIGKSYSVLHNQYGTLITYFYNKKGYHFDYIIQNNPCSDDLGPIAIDIAIDLDRNDIITINKDGHMQKVRNISSYEDDIVSFKLYDINYSGYTHTTKWKIPYDKFINPINVTRNSGIYLYNNEVVTTLPVLKYDREGKGYIHFDRLGYPPYCKVQLMTMFKCLYVLRIKSMVGLVRKLISDIYKRIYIMEGYLSKKL
jgi:hypothetical protein